MSYQSNWNTRSRFSSILAGSAGKPSPGFPGHFPTTSTVREADRCLHNRKQRDPALHSTRTGLSSHTSMPKEVRKLPRSEEHTSELQSLRHLVCRLLLEKKK